MGDKSPKNNSKAKKQKADKKTREVPKSAPVIGQTKKVG